MRKTAFRQSNELELVFSFPATFSPHLLPIVVAPQRAVCLSPIQGVQWNSCQTVYYVVYFWYTCIPIVEYPGVADLLLLTSPQICPLLYETHASESQNSRKPPLSPMGGKKERQKSDFVKMLFGNAQSLFLSIVVQKWHLGEIGEGFRCMKSKRALNCKFITKRLVWNCTELP